MKPKEPYKQTITGRTSYEPNLQNIPIRTILGEQYKNAVLKQIADEIIIEEKEGL